ncbi:MAG: helix-turn-helix domain-containing protein [Terriglobales bacterium]
MFSEAIYTLEEVAQHLRVPVEAVRQEIEAGRLTALNVAGLVRIGESDLNAYKNQARAIAPPAARSSPASSAAPVNGDSFLKLHNGADFTHRWPDASKEDYKDVHEGVASYGGRTYHVKLGFTVREAAGKKRLRSLVLVDRYATVEFAGADDNLTDSSLIASVIKDRSGKQLPAGAAVPPEYQGLPIGSYREVVDGPGASNGMAVVCQASDFETMVKHALIRYTYRAERS